MYDITTMYLNGWTDLLCVVHNSNIEVVEFKLDQDLDNNNRVSASGCGSALELAVCLSFANTEKYKLLTERGG